MKKSYAFFIGMVFASSFMIGCGKKAASTAGPTNLSSIPKATGKVFGAKSTSIAKLEDYSISKNLISLMSAATGQPASTFSNLTWDSTKSGPFCEAGNTTVTLLQNSAIPDNISCHIAAGETAGWFTVKYDGSDHFISITNSAGTSPANTNPKVKYNGTKNADGSIASFSAWTCFNTLNKQDIYVNATNSSGTVTLTSVLNMTISQPIQGTPTTIVFTETNVATGAVTSTGDWNGSKSITFDGTFSVGSLVSGGEHTAGTFYPDYVNFTSYGSNSFQGTSETFSLASRMQLLPLNYDLTNMAFGDGCTNFKGGFGSQSYQETKCWLGDTSKNLSDSTQGMYYSAVNSATLPTQATVATQNFTGSQAWDCTLGADVTTVDMSKLNNDGDTCDKTYPTDGGGGDCGSAGW